MIPAPSKYQYFAGRDFNAITVFTIVLGSKSYVKDEHTGSLRISGIYILLGSLVGVYGVFNDINSIIYFYSFFLLCIMVAQVSVSMSSYTVK